MDREVQTFSVMQRWLIVAAVMSATLMQVIDTTIVNVALPHMQGSLGTSPDSITWTLTSYLVSSAIFMPLTGYFTDIFGRRNFLILSIAGFTIVSILCGASNSLSEIVICRMLQGVFGASLVPLSQAIVTDVFPPEERGKAMAIWGVGVMVGPVLGPTLGGYLTEYFSWRWTFYVNVPVGIFALLLTPVVPDTAKIKRPMDWLGLLLISTAIGGTQYVLDRGNQADWFNSTQICVITFLAIAGLLGFLLHNLHRKENIVFDLRMFKDKNFTISSLLLAILGLGLYGTMVIQPLMMENLFNYPVIISGLVMAPRGLSGMISMILMSRLINHIDPRYLIAFGICLSAVGMLVGTHYSINISPYWLIWPLFLQGFGMGMIFVPLATVAFSTLPVHFRSEAAGLFSLLRTIGSSMGISVAITVLTRHSQMLWNQFGGFINPYNRALYPYLQTLHLQPSQPKAIGFLGKLIGEQSQMSAFVNVYAFIMWSFILMLPLIFMLKKQEGVAQGMHVIE